MLSPKVCEKMLAYWYARDVWLNKTGTTFPVKEIWHGSHFKELQWFWDPSSTWLSPHQCKECNHIQSINDFVTGNNNLCIECPQCGCNSTIESQYAHGDPRNIGLIGHWDGWQPAFFLHIYNL